jgi:hypothetical protein
MRNPSELERRLLLSTGVRLAPRRIGPVAPSFGPVPTRFAVTQTARQPREA